MNWIKSICCDALPKTFEVSNGTAETNLCSECGEVSEFEEMMPKDIAKDNLLDR